MANRGVLSSVQGHFISIESGTKRCYYKNSERNHTKYVNIQKGIGDMMSGALIQTSAVRMNDEAEKKKSEFIYRL